MTAMGVNRFVVMLRMVSHDVVYEDFAGIGV
jgi:hypothetical protein